MTAPGAIVGVIGAGVMGAGVAETLAAHGYRPILIDRDEETLRHAARQIRQSLRAARMMGTAPSDEPVDSILERIDYAESFESVRDAKIVIENVTEDVATKQTVYRRLDTVCDSDSIFIANTSCIPIGKLGGFTERPDRVIGVHFMNPVPMKPTVEMIPAAATSHETVERVTNFLETLGKRCVMVGDAVGFVSNRVLMLTINEAIGLVDAGTANAKDVDEIFRSCFGHPMGPLETADLIGLDTIMLSLIVLRDELGDDKYEPCGLLRRMVEAGRRGRKSGEGLFTYTRGNRHGAG